MTNLAVSLETGRNLLSCVVTSLEVSIDHGLNHLLHQHFTFTADCRYLACLWRQLQQCWVDHQLAIWHDISNDRSSHAGWQHRLETENNLTSLLDLTQLVVNCPNQRLCITFACYVTIVGYKLFCDTCGGSFIDIGLFSLHLALPTVWHEAQVHPTSGRVRWKPADLRRLNVIRSARCLSFVWGWWTWYSTCWIITTFLQ